MLDRRPAPIASGLAATLAASLPDSRTLPAEAYTSAELFEWELERLFEATWVCVGRADSLSEPGDQAAARVGLEGILLVRGRDGLLRGFYDVCRHRGHQLLPAGERRRARAIRCPYHAWAYDLEGRLAAAPGFRDQHGFDREDFPLVPVRVAEWRGFVFVNASGEAPSLAEHLGNLEDLVAPWRPERLFVGGRRDYVVRTNWKVLHENYHECYHCSNIHPELCRVSPPESGVNVRHSGVWLGGWMGLREGAETMSLDGRSRGVRIPGLPDEQARRIWYYALFPNLFLSLHPDYVLTHRLEPVAVGETRVECLWLFAPEARERPGFDPRYAVEFWDVTNRQDWAAVESVHRGLRSRGFRQGPFARSEDEVWQFMAMVARAYLDGRVSPPPALQDG